MAGLAVVECSRIRRASRERRSNQSMERIPNSGLRQGLGSLDKLRRPHEIVAHQIACVRSSGFRTKDAKYLHSVPRHSRNLSPYLATIAKGRFQFTCVRLAKVRDENG